MMGLLPSRELPLAQGRRRVCIRRKASSSRVWGNSALLIDRPAYEAACGPDVSVALNKSSRLRVSSLQGRGNISPGCLQRQPRQPLKAISRIAIRWPGEKRRNLGQHHPQTFGSDCHIIIREICFFMVRRSQSLGQSNYLPVVRHGIHAACIRKTSVSRTGQQTAREEVRNEKGASVTSTWIARCGRHRSRVRARR